MSTAELRREIKNAVDRLPHKRLESLVDYVHFLTRPELSERIVTAEKLIAAGKGVKLAQGPLRCLRSYRRLKRSDSLARRKNLLAKKLVRCRARETGSPQKAGFRHSH
jgi:hypothetical protein